MINNTSGENDQITAILMVVLSVLMLILIIFVIIFLVLKAKERKNKVQEIKGNNKQKNKSKNKSKNKKEEKTQTILSKGSIMDFMEFEKIQDNMIVVKNKKKYVMVVECKGVNYDLMSQPEKIGVEEGFQKFLNTLRYPIQIYIQTRTINLESSIQRYQNKIKEIEKEYRKKENQLKEMRKGGKYNENQLNKAMFELTRQRNLYEYGKDLVLNTEKMSLNKSVLNKSFFIIIPYYPEVGGNKYYDQEIISQAFNELYTRAQTLIRILSSCYVKGKILDSRELVELLYVAYNRDDSELLNINKIMSSGYESLYSTSVDVFEKKNLMLDNEINKKAMQIARESVNKVKSRIQKEAEQKEENIEQLAKRMAAIILETNKEVIGTSVANKAIKEIQEEGGEDTNEKEQKK